MCRNIRTLFNFTPPATDEEIRAAALQFVRKVSGFNAPSKTNEAAFNLAVEQVDESIRTLIRSLSTSAPPRDRETERAEDNGKSQEAFRTPRGRPGRVGQQVVSGLQIWGHTTHFYAMTKGKKTQKREQTTFTWVKLWCRGHQ